MKWEWRVTGPEEFCIGIWIPYHGWRGSANFRLSSCGSTAFIRQVEASTKDHKSIKKQGPLVYGALIQACRELGCRWLCSDTSRSKGANHAWNALRKQYAVTKMTKGRLKLSLNSRESSG